MNIVYILPKRSFFEKGPRGSVSHAQGVVEGFSRLGHCVTVVGGSSTSLYFDDNKVRIESVHRRTTFIMVLTRLLLCTKDKHLFIIRHASSLSLFLFLVSKIFSWAGQGKIILEVNSLAYHNLKTTNRFLAGFVNMFETKLIASFDYYYSVSTSLTGFLSKYFDKSKIVTIPNGATDDAWEFGRSNSRGIRFVYLGSQQPYYNFEHIIKAFQDSLTSDSDAKLVIYGAENKSLNLTRYSGPNILFKGAYNKNDLIDVVYDSDFLILPPKYDWDIETSGGLSTKVFEYMSMGLNVIVPRTPELETFFVHGTNAIVYDQYDSKSLPHLMANIGKYSNKNLGAQLRKDFLVSFSWKSRMKNMLDFIEHG